MPENFTKMLYCRGGPAADSLRTLAIIQRILIVLRPYCGKLLYIVQ